MGVVCGVVCRVVREGGQWVVSGAGASLFNSPSKTERYTQRLTKGYMGDGGAT